MSFRPLLCTIAALASLSVLPLPAAAQVPAAPVAAHPYADLADLVLAAPVIADATVRSTAKLKGADAAGAPAGTQRLYVEADVTALIRGQDGMPARVGYLLDVTPDARGKFPSFKKQRVLLFARAIAAGQLQLIAPDAQLSWTAPDDVRVRAIATEALAADAPPRITGVGNAFHVPGALPGEGETQVFLQTADGRPVSLSVLRRPGEQPRWAVALSEIVDESAAPPPPDSLLRYRLACGLPPSLPERSTAGIGADDAAGAKEDYRFVLAQLGPCGRTRA